MTDKPEDKVTLTRRQAVGALGAGVFLASGAAAVAGVEATNWAKREGEHTIQDLQFQLAELQKKNDEAHKQLAAANLQLEVFKGLFALYETLDKIGIDAIVAGALDAYKATLDALEAGVDSLKAGIVSAENALDNFESTFAAIRNALTSAENAWANVSALLKNVQDLVKDATSPLLSFLDQARKFFDDLLGKIPFGAGEPARRTINGIIGLIVAIPSALDSLDDGLFQTLRENWFSDDNARNLEAVLTKPIIQGVLQPAHKFLEQVDATLNSWEAQVSKPVNAAVSQRDIVKQQIVEYKKKNGI